MGKMLHNETCIYICGYIQTYIYTWVWVWVDYSPKTSETAVGTAKQSTAQGQDTSKWTAQHPSLSTYTYIYPLKIMCCA